MVVNCGKQSHPGGFCGRAYSCCSFYGRALGLWFWMVRPVVVGSACGNSVLSVRQYHIILAGVGLFLILFGASYLLKRVSGWCGRTHESEKDIFFRMILVVLWALLGFYCESNLILLIFLVCVVLQINPLIHYLK